MPNPRWEIPFDRHGRIAKWMNPRATALDSRSQAITQSSHFVLDEDTTLLQVSAISKDMFLKWANDGEDYATSTDFDEFIPAGTTIFVMIPLNDDESGDFYTGIQIVGREASGRVAIVEK